MRRRSVLARGLALMISLGLFLPFGPALAQSLDQLRASGAVGERFDGLAVARENTPAVRSFVDGVNARRLDIYRQKAQAQGVPVEQVGRVYATEIMRSAPRGTWFLEPSGRWRQ
ncbi:MAG: YdbL family protein [Pseudomonadota bacterium]|nr:YdbL family protein [Pseudomonadota bacterium]